MTYAHDASDNRAAMQDIKGGLATMTLASANNPNLIRRGPGPADGSGRIVTDTTGANGDGCKYTGREWDATAQPTNLALRMRKTLVNLLVCLAAYFFLDARFST